MFTDICHLLGKILALLGLSLPFVCPPPGGPGGPGEPGRRDLTGAAEATYEAHGSVEQVWLTGAEPGTTLELVSRHGRVVASGEADAEGSLILRDVRPAEGYRVASGAGDGLVATPALEVAAPDDAPDQAFYDAQEIGPGYGYLTTRDGTSLSINVRLPGPVEDGPYPTVVEYSGYAVSDPDSTEPSSLISGALGYATVGVNIRGTGCSGGAFEFFETLQGTDGYDIVETIAAQDWVLHGEVGMVGLSYPGISQLFVAQYDPPSLAAIAPLSVIGDTARGTLAPGGMTNSGFAVSWAEERRRDAQPGGQAWSQRRMDAGDQQCIDNQVLRGQSPDIIEMIEEAKFWTDEQAAPLAPELFVHRIDDPVFLAGAWQDEQTGGYFANMLDDFTGTDDAWFTVTNGTHTDALGPEIFARWMEFLSLFVKKEVPSVPASATALLPVVAQQIFGVSVELPPDRFTDVTDYDEALARFRADPRVRILFDNGAGAAPGAPVPGFEAGFDTWPIAEGVATEWFLGEGGALVDAAPAGESTDDYRYDPARGQVTTFSGGGSDIWRALPEYHWTPAPDGTALTYDTAPLTDDLVVVGSASVDLWLRSTAPDTDLQVTLSEVRPDGAEIYVQSGWLRASHRALHPDATAIRPLHPFTEEANEPLPADDWAEARVEVFPFGHAFRAGSRLRLTVDSPGGSRPLWKFDTLPAEGEVRNTLGIGGVHPSSVVLPVVDGVDVPTPPPHCLVLRGQPCRK